MIKKTVLILIFSILIAFFVYTKNAYLITFITSDGEKVSFEIELAITAEQRATGLMFRENLADNHAMLFVFQDQNFRNFWMKNTKIPLDMIFLDNDLKVVHIIHQALPCESEPCQVYYSQLPAQYVLEIKADLAKQKRLQIGDQAELFL